MPLEHACMLLYWLLEVLDVMKKHSTALDVLCAVVQDVLQPIDRPLSATRQQCSCKMLCFVAPVDTDVVFTGVWFGAKTA